MDQHKIETRGEETLLKEQDKQTRILEKAQKTEPAYETQHYLARKALNEWAKRMDTPDKLWYVYLRANNGALIGYHVCRTPPLSFGLSMTNPEQVVERDNDDDKVVSAPGLDGVYYSGADPELYFCFDAETNTMIHFRIGNSTYYDAPLEGTADSPELKIKVDE